MKYLILCEGSNEKTIIDLLLDNNKLKISRDDLLELTPYNIRQLDNPFIKSIIKKYNNTITIYRIGDTQKDKFTIPKDLENYVSKDRIFKFCTKPEIEMLIIINENKYQDYIKWKNKRKNHNSPYEYVEEKIMDNKNNYKKSNDYLLEYYGDKNIDNLVKNIKEYARIKKHKKGELFLADLLK